MTGWLLRPEAAGDVDGIAAVHTAAFPDQPIAELVAALRVSPAFLPGLSMVADEDGTIVGHVMVTRAHVGEAPVLCLSPLGVLPDHWRRGIGAALVRAVTAEADRRGESLVALQGDPRYYSRFGFGPASAHGIEMDLPDWAPPEAAQVLPLANDEPSIRGRLVLPPPFEGID